MRNAGFRVRLFPFAGLFAGLLMGGALLPAVSAAEAPAPVADEPAPTTTPPASESTDKETPPHAALFPGGWGAAPAAPDADKKNDPDDAPDRPSRQRLRQDWPRHSARFGPRRPGSPASADDAASAENNAIVEPLPSAPTLSTESSGAPEPSEPSGALGGAEDAAARARGKDAQTGELESPEVMRDELSRLVDSLRRVVDPLRIHAREGRFRPPALFFPWLERLAERSLPDDNSPVEPAAWRERARWLREVIDTLLLMEERLGDYAFAPAVYPRLAGEPLLREARDQWLEWVENSARALIDGPEEEPEAGSAAPAAAAVGDASFRRRLRDIDSLTRLRLELAEVSAALAADFPELTGDPDLAAFAEFAGVQDISARLEIERLRDPTERATRYESDPENPEADFVAGLLRRVTGPRDALGVWRSYFDWLRRLHSLERRHDDLRESAAYQSAARLALRLRRTRARAVDTALAVAGEPGARASEHEKALAEFKENQTLLDHALALLDARAAWTRGRDRLARQKEQDPGLSEAPPARALEESLERLGQALDEADRASASASADPAKDGSDGSTAGAFAAHYAALRGPIALLAVRVEIWREETDEEVDAREAMAALSGASGDDPESRRALGEAREAMALWRAFRAEAARRRLAREELTARIAELRFQREAREEADDAWAEGREDAILERFHRAADRLRQ